MVRKVNSRLTDFKFHTGAISISVTEFLNLLSDESIFDKVEFTAENKGYFFESLNDIKENQQLLDGRPEITGMFPSNSYFYIKFNEGAEVYSYNLKSEEELTRLVKAGRQLNTHRNPLHVFKFLSFGWVLILWIISSLGLFQLIIPYLMTNPQTFSVFDWTVFGIVTLSTMLLIIKFIFFKLWRPVYLGSKLPLWERIKDNIYSYIAVFFTGIILASLVSLFRFQS